MDVKLNCAPYLRMDEITKRLFNRNFLSDIRFSVNGKIIYAHSLELMKRSVVFERQLEDTLGDKKLIPIVDCKYEIFLEFVRYIYTDECTINDDNGIELLKLATRYQIIMLENRVINLLASRNWILQLFEHCVIDKYEIARQRSNDLLASNINDILYSTQFLTLHQDAVNATLQLEKLERGVTEIEIFNALTKWIQNYCKQHNLLLTEGRQRFDGLIKQIRFPTMLNSEIRDCVKKNPDFLSDKDCQSIGKQILFGGNNVNDSWISKPRRVYTDPVEWLKINHTKVFETIFTVKKNMYLQGLWIGVEENRVEIEIEITVKDIKTNKREKIQFTQSAPKRWRQMLISFGEFILLKPNFEYTIVIKYLGITNGKINVVCRLKNINLIYHNPNNTIKILKTSDNMIEMLFKSATT